MKIVSCTLNNVKSRYFMLLACLSLLLATTSCNNDELEFNDPQSQKQYTKAELIEQALSRMPQTRAENPNAVIMVSIQDTINFQCTATDTMKVFLDGEEHPMPITETNKYCYKKFTDSLPSHSITIVGDKDAIRSLNVDNNGLILLSASKNSQLSYLSCAGNYLDEINLTDCSSLSLLDISNNEFSSIDVSGFPELTHFCANHNRLTALNFSGNPELYLVEAEHNPLKELDFQENPYLMYLYISFTQVTSLNLSQCPYLTDLYLEETPIKIINNHPICDTSFVMYKELWKLNIAYTSFSSVDLSNTMVYILNISGTGITRLDISGLNMQYLYATRSQLTDLIYDDLKNLYELRIERTPFEKEATNIVDLAQSLPTRTKENPGHLYTYFSHINQFIQDFTRINWVINR